MSATLVASSNQMFSTFGQPTRSPSPAFNPFATNSENKGSAFGIDSTGDSSKTKRTKRSSAFGDQSDNEAKRKANKQFKNKDANLSDGGGRNKNRKSDEKKKNTDPKKNLSNTATFSRKQAGQNTRSNGSTPFAATRIESRPTSSSSANSDDEPIPDTYHSDDPQAKRVYEQLRKDGIHPPQWPSQPGNPKNKAEVTKFREKYETYRNKARASLTKAGLIDDPDKRKTLQDAIDFKGICEDMCPEYEKITRINEMDVHQPEKNPKTTYANTRRMVKKLARSAAGQEAPLPMDVRSVPALKRTLDYLIDDLLRDDGNLPVLHGFLWDRTRAIRRDFTFFSSLTPDEMKIQVYVLENIARFHVTALHLLTRDGKTPEDFVEQQELEQLGKALLSLRDAYDDCNDQGIRCENEPEFRAYYLIFHAYDSNIIETLQRQWKPALWKDSNEVRTAVLLVEALQNTQDFHGPLKDAPSLAASAAYQSYFRIVEDPKVSYTMACFAECHFPRLRRAILAAINRGLARPRETSKDVTAAVLNKFLRFDTIEQAVEFAELHNIEFGQCDEDPSDASRQYAKLDSRGSLPHLRLQHQFSYSLVEKKRGSKSLPELIHQTTYQSANPSKAAVNGSSQESLFVPETKPTPNKTTIPTGPKATTPNPFASFGKPSEPGGDNKPINGNSGTTINGTASISASGSQQTPFQKPPFVSGLASTAKPPAVNPFAHTTSALTPSSAGNASHLPAPTPEQPPRSGNGNRPVLNPFASSFKPPTTSAEQAQSSPFGQGSAYNEKEATSGTTFTSLPAPTAVASTENTSSKVIVADKPQLHAPTITSTQPANQPSINIFPPTPQLSSSPFTTVTQPQKSSTPSDSSATSQATIPPAALNLGKTTTLTGEQGKPATSFFDTQSPTTSTPQFSFPSVGTSSLSHPASNGGGSQLPTTPTAAQIAKEPIRPPEPPSPPRDLLGDFTRWFVTGDDGLMDEFQAFMLDNILQGVYRKYVKEEEARRQKEEEEQALAEAQKFRIYSLSVRYFYRWKEIARDRRLSQLRRSGREQMRAYYEAQRVAQAKAQREAARQAAREQAEIAELNRPEELKGLLKHKKPSKRRQAAEEDALLASGVLSGINNEQEAVARIVRRAPSATSSISSKQSSSSLARSGSKTRALRQQFGDQSATFRRSLPPVVSRNAESPEPSNRVSRVSERWRLKAMGIVQMPDGTALPERLANEMQYGKKQSTGSMGPPSSGFKRRASISGLGHSEERHRLSGSHGTVDTTESDSSATNKRKRATDDDGELAQDDQTKISSHKRVMSDAQTLIDELRAMREEMEEGATWFKDQNDRMQSELISRGSTPWDQDI
ncbi:related to leucine permease transcriptional regulator SAC3 [Fusarium fujikuroi]|nr:related to leucine permease transcriptional regulator SAC3 [Fusarium fujikuroi]